MNAEELKARTKIFAHACVKLATNLSNTSLGNHLKNQLIRSSTSVAANYRATCVSQTIKVFISKISIVIEEIDETQFWLEFIVEENLIEESKVNSILKESNELKSIFIASRKTAQKNQQSTINN
jgi:four helix bundle protein